MKISIEQISSHDKTLRWTMRVIGMVLVVASAFFLSKEIFQHASATWFFGISAGLGIITLISSWLPAPKRMPLQESPIMQPVSRSR